MRIPAQLSAVGTYLTVKVLYWFYHLVSIPFLVLFYSQAPYYLTFPSDMCDKVTVPSRHFIFLRPLFSCIVDSDSLCQCVYFGYYSTCCLTMNIAPFVVPVSLNRIESDQVEGFGVMFCFNSVDCSG